MQGIFKIRAPCMIYATAPFLVEVGFEVGPSLCLVHSGYMQKGCGCQIICMACFT